MSTSAIDDDVQQRSDDSRLPGPPPARTDFMARLAAGPRPCRSCGYLRLPSAAGTCPDCGIRI